MATLHSNGSLGFRWALGGVTVTAFGNYAMQSADVEDTGETYEVKDGSGTTIIWYGFDHKRMANWEYIVTGTSANTSASITSPGFGTMFTVTDTSGGSNPLTGSNYIVLSATVKETNKDAATVTVKTVAYDTVTS